MKKEHEIICNFIYEFVDAKWDKIDKKKTHIIKSKEDFLKEVKSNVQTACWIIFDVAWWGMDKEYLRDIILDLDKEFQEYTIININNNYLKLYAETLHSDWKISFCTGKEIPVKSDFKEGMEFIARVPCSHINMWLHIDHILPSYYKDVVLVVYRVRYKKSWREFMCTEEELKTYIYLAKGYMKETK